MQIQLKLNLRLLPLLVVLLILLQLVLPYRGWMILLVGLGGAWLSGYIWARSLAHGLTLTREQRFGWAQVGDRLEERFTLTKRGLLPALWVEFMDHSTLPDYQASVAVGVEGNSQNGWSIQRVCTRRGIFTLGPTTLRTGDPFGIYSVLVHYPASASLVVMPPIVPLPSIEVAPGGCAGVGRQHASSFEPTVIVAGIREYAPGDPLTSIHWKAVAQRDRLLVRLFENLPAGDWWVVLDLDERVQAGSGENSTVEHSIIVAASLADRGLRSGRAVGLIAQSENLVWLPPRVGEGQRWEILRALAVAEPGQQPLAELLARARPSLRQSSSLVIVTPSGEREWVRTLLPLVWRGTIPTVLLLDAASFGGAGDLNVALESLSEWGIAHHVITRDLLNRTGLNSGRQGDWKWRITPGGRAIAARETLNQKWKVLA